MWERMARPAKTDALRARKQKVCCFRVFTGPKIGPNIEPKPLGSLSEQEPYKIL